MRRRRPRGGGSWLRSLVRCKQLPIVLDMVEDRVQARSLSALLFATVALWVMRQTLVSIFLFSAAGPASVQPAFVSVGAAAALGNANVETGLFAHPPPEASVTDTAGQPAPAVRVGVFALFNDPGSVTNPEQRALRRESRPKSRRRCFDSAFPHRAGLDGTDMDFRVFAPSGVLELPG